MSSVPHSLERPSAAGCQPLAGPALALRAAPLLVPLGALTLLVGAGPTLLVGYALLLLGCLARGRAGLARLAATGPLDVGWLGLLLGSVVGFAVSANSEAAAGRLAAIVATVALFFWLEPRVRSPSDLRRLSMILVAASAIGILAILALVNGQLPESQLTRRLAPVLQLFAAFPPIRGDVLEVNSRFPVHQYGLAYLLLVTIPVLTAQAALGSGRPARSLAGLAALLLTVLLAATEARGALLALALSVALVVSLRSRWFWLLLPAGALGVYLLLARGVISRSIEVAWLDTRLSIWTRSLNLLADYPFTGAGLGMQTFAEVFAWTFKLPSRYEVVHSHNILIQAYAEQGLLGLIGLILVLTTSLLLAWRAARSAPLEARPAAAGVLGALVGTTLYGVTDQVPTTHYGLAIVAALCALAAGGARLAILPSRSPAMPSNSAGDPALLRMPPNSFGGPSSLRRPPNSFGVVRAAATPWATETNAMPDRLARLAHRRPGLLLAALALALLIPLSPRWVSGLALNVGAAQVVGVALSPAADAAARTATLDRARAWLAIATAWNPKNTAAFRVQARARLLQHDVSGALAAAEAARATGNLNEYERMQIGRIYYELGHWQPALELWQAAGQQALIRQAADDLALKRDFQGSAAAHAALVELNPDEPEHYSNLAKAILAGPTPSVDEAMRWFERAAELNPPARRSLATQLVLQGEPYRINERRDRGRFDLAVFWFSLASRVDPTYDKPLVELGSTYYRNGLASLDAGRGEEAQLRFDEAARHFTAATRLDPQNSSSWHQLGEAEEAAGRLPAAVAAFEHAVTVAPRRGGLRASLGRIFARVGRCEDARRELAEAGRLPDENGSLGRAQAELARIDHCRP